MPINSARAGARKLLGSPQAMHAAVMLAFPESPVHDGDGARVLWRLDKLDTPRPLLYVSSGERPDLTHIVEQAGWPTSEGWESRPYGKLLDRLETGQRWAFRLTANPVHSRRGAGEGRGKRFGHVTVAHQEQWLLAKAEHHGFAVAKAESTGELDLVVHQRRTVSFKRGRDDKAAVRLVTATYDGVLEVTKPDALRDALTKGIGKAKGYGCGLMTLAPVG